MRRAVEAIDRARNLVETGASEELIAAEVRLALENIALITGEVYTEDILDRIFSRFCIGK
jgi:tRNA modification GTPase